MLFVVISFYLLTKTISHDVARFATVMTNIISFICYAFRGFFLEALMCIYDL